MDICYESIRDRLLDGEFPAGGKISVEALVAELGVSKQPVMEALRRLDSDGLVVIKPQVGCEVARFSDREVGDFFKLFGAAEGAIGAMAAQRRRPEQIIELRQAANATYDLHDSSDAELRSRQFRLANRRFHAITHTMADCEMTTSFVERMWDVSDLIINTYTHRRVHSEAMEKRESEHRRIVEAIADGDPATARRELEHHVICTSHLVLGAHGELAATGS